MLSKIVTKFREDFNHSNYEFNDNASEKDRVQGCIIGFAIGDALGSPVEFKTRTNLVTDFEPSSTKGLKAGQYTDDTQHLLISLDSLIKNNGEIDLEDQALRLRRWYASGNARSLGYTTEQAIKRLNSGISPTDSGLDSPNSCGSLAIARLIPYSLLSALLPHERKITRNNTRKILGITHAHPLVLNMGELINYYIQEMIHGKNVEAVTYQIVTENIFLNKKARKKLEKILECVDKDPLEIIKKIGNSGFVEEVVYSSLHSVTHGPSFKESLLNSVNGFGDSDSRGAITGALYGLQVGCSMLPKDWKDKVEDGKLLKDKAEKLYFLAV